MTDKEPVVSNRTAPAEKTRRSGPQSIRAKPAINAINQVNTVTPNRQPCQSCQPCPSPAFPKGQPFQPVYQATTGRLQAFV